MPRAVALAESQARDCVEESWDSGADSLLPFPRGEGLSATYAGFSWRLRVKEIELRVRRSAETNDFELVSEPIVFISMSFYSKLVLSQSNSWKYHLLDVLEHKLSRARCARAQVESCSITLEPMLSRARSHSRMC